MTDQGSVRALAGERMRELTRWAAGVKADAIPDAVLRRAALVLADNLAATVAAESEPEVKAAQACPTERSTVQEALHQPLALGCPGGRRRASALPWRK